MLCILFDSWGGRRGGGGLYHECQLVEPQEICSIFLNFFKNNTFLSFNSVFFGFMSVVDGFIAEIVSRCLVFYRQSLKLNHSTGLIL